MRKRIGRWIVSAEFGKGRPERRRETRLYCPRVTHVRRFSGGGSRLVSAARTAAGGRVAPVYRRWISDWFFFSCTKRLFVIENLNGSVHDFSIGWSTKPEDDVIEPKRMIWHGWVVRFGCVIGAAASGARKQRVIVEVRAGEIQSAT